MSQEPLKSRNKSLSGCGFLSSRREKQVDAKKTDRAAGRAPAHAALDLSVRLSVKALDIRRSNKTNARLRVDFEREQAVV